MDSRLSEVVLESLEGPASSEELARRAYQSRASFFRLFQALVEETPGAMRRRLRLEKAAWQLRDTKLAVTEIALNAEYGSLEAFTRAFKKAFQVSPSLYRRTGRVRIHLPAPNEFHFRPREVPSQGRAFMDLFDLFAGTDSWYTRKLLEQAAGLSEEQLDAELNAAGKVFAWDKPDRSLREILERMVQTKEIWTAAFTGGEMPLMEGRPAEERTPAALLERFEKVEAQFQKVLCEVRNRGGWDESFVDALCEPTESFTYGGMFAHVITFNTYRRIAALEAFHRLGVQVQGEGDPFEYRFSVTGQH